MRYDYASFVQDVPLLARRIGSPPECILAIARGGLVLGQFLAYHFGCRELHTLTAKGYEGQQKQEKVTLGPLPPLSLFSSVLLVDDIADSGASLAATKDAITSQFPNLRLACATLFYKKTAIVKPDFSLHEAHEWIDFFWEIDAGRFA